MCHLIAVYSKLSNRGASPFNYTCTKTLSYVYYAHSETVNLLTTISLKLYYFSYPTLEPFNYKRGCI